MTIAAVREYVMYATGTATHTAASASPRTHQRGACALQASAIDTVIAAQTPTAFQ